MELYELTRGEADELADANGMFREVCHLDGLQDAFEIAAIQQNQSFDALKLVPSLDTN